MKDAYKKFIIYGIGNVFVWYSYTLFMPFFLIISQQFFPCSDKLSNMLVGFAVFGLGLITRPIGSYIFGKIGDSICRETAVGISLTVLSVSTVAIGCIPSYENLGIVSSILVTLARAMQGIAMGGAANVAMVQIVEIVPDSRKGIAGCIPNAANLAGLLISNSIFSFLYLNVSDLSFIWRLPFLGSAVLLFFALTQFKSAQCSRRETPQPLSISSFRKYYLELICVFLLTAFSATCYYLAFAFMPNYMLSHFGGGFANVVTIMSAFLLVAIFVSGHLSDKFSRIPVLISSFMVIICGSLVVLCISNLVYAGELLIYTLGAALAIYYGTSGAFFTMLFPKEIRCTAVAVPMSFSQAFFGGLAPIIATKLTSFSFYWIILLLLSVSISALVIIMVIKRKYDRTRNIERV